jgi:hypothetical protein
MMGRRCVARKSGAKSILKIAFGEQAGQHALDELLRKIVAIGGGCGGGERGC